MGAIRAKIRVIFAVIMCAALTLIQLALQVSIEVERDRDDYNGPPTLVVVADISTPLPPEAKKEIEIVHREPERLRSSPSPVDEDSIPITEKIADLLEQERSPPLSTLPPCRVLITNYRTDFHLEVLESLYAKFPFRRGMVTEGQQLLLESCNQTSFEVDFHVKRDTRSTSWMSYANNSMPSIVYNTELNDVRRYGQVIRQSVALEASALTYDVIVEASCYCDEAFIDMLSSSKNMYCIFHESCKAVEMQERAYWVNPSFPRFVFPDVMPQFTSSGAIADRRQELSLQAPTLPYHLCLIGDPGRRHFNLYRKFMRRSNNGTYSLDDRMQLWIMGSGAMPKGLAIMTNQTRQVRTQNYLEFQRLVAAECHVIMILLDLGKTPGYFVGQRKLSGAIVQASAYRIPVVIHVDLYRNYEPYLKDQHVETHDNNPDTFTPAMRRMLSYLDNIVEQSGHVSPLLEASTPEVSAAATTISADTTSRELQVEQPIAREVSKKSSSKDTVLSTRTHDAARQYMDLEELPYLPILKPDCQVILSDDLSICGNGITKADIVLSERLLEHRFHCSATNVLSSQISLRNSNTSCVDLSGFRYLIPFVQPGFYYLPTYRVNASRILCVSDDESQFPDFSGNISESSLRIQRITPMYNASWSGFYEKLRYCDYVYDSSDANLDLIVAADSIGVPTLRGESFTDLSQFPSRPAYFGYRKTRFNFTTANETVTRFPFHTFQAISTTGADTEKKESGNKTLVIMLGNLRGGEKTWESMYRNLLDLNNADLALMIGKQVNKSNSSMYGRAKFLWEFDEYEDWGDAIDEAMNSSTWRKIILPQVSVASGLFGGVGKRVSSTAISFMARYWLIQKLNDGNILEKYDRFVLSRSDHFYKCKHDLSLLDPRYIWVPTAEDYGGITDRHMVCHRTHMLPSIDMYPHFLSHPEKYFFENRFMKENAERMIRLRWIDKGLYPHHIKRFPRMMYTAATRADTSRWRKVNHPWTKLNVDGLLTKYDIAYDFTQCFCANGTVTDKKTKRRVELNDAEREFRCRL